MDGYPGATKRPPSFIVAAGARSEAMTDIASQNPEKLSLNSGLNNINAPG
jgi:hypothetical protein